MEKNSQIKTNKQKTQKTESKKVKKETNFINSFLEFIIKCFAMDKDANTTEYKEKYQSCGG
jgi:hypothetical protein